jgi:hypothetical protein
MEVSAGLEMEIAPGVEAANLKQQKGLFANEFVGIES